MKRFNLYHAGLVMCVAVVMVGAFIYSSTPGTNKAIAETQWIPPNPFEIDLTKVEPTRLYYLEARLWHTLTTGDNQGGNSKEDAAIMEAILIKADPRWGNLIREKHADPKKWSEQIKGEQAKWAEANNADALKRSSK